MDPGFREYQRSEARRTAQFEPGSPLPRWKQASTWVGLTIGIVSPLLWIFALVSYNRLKNGRNREPYWAWEYGAIFSVLFVLALVLTLSGVYD
jgi:hypothetical protein